MAPNATSPLERFLVFHYTPQGLIWEVYGCGLMFTSAVLLGGFALASMRKRVLHYLILAELALIVPRSLEVFFTFPGRYWLHSAVCLPLDMAYVLHNYVSWLKIRPFLSKWMSLIFVGLLTLTIPYWLVGTYGNFRFYNFNQRHPWTQTRDLEMPFRDPFWIFTCFNLIWNIKRRYKYTILEVISINPRFGVLFFAMGLSISFLLIDFAVTLHPLNGNTSINPFSKLALVAKCFCDVVIIDDFKTALDRIPRSALGRSKYQAQTAGQTTTGILASLKPIRGGKASKKKDLEAGSEMELHRKDDDPNIHVDQSFGAEKHRRNSEGSPERDSAFPNRSFFN